MVSEKAELQVISEGGATRQILVLPSLLHHCTHFPISDSSSETRNSQISGLTEPKLRPHFLLLFNLFLRLFFLPDRLKNIVVWEQTLFTSLRLKSHQLSYTIVFLLSI